MPQQVISALIALFLGVSPVAPAQVQPSSTSATVARLRVSIQTSSSQATVRFSPGRVLASRVVDYTTGVTAKADDAGWTVTSPPGKTSTVVLEAAYEEPTRASLIRISVAGVSSGSTLAIVDNTSAKTFSVARVAAGPASAPRGVSVVRSRSQVLGARDPGMPKADPRRLVLAVYYPWYAGATYRRADLSDHPSEPRSTKDYAGVLAMTRQARASGIDGFLVSWAGNAQNGAALDLSVRAATAAGSTVGLYLETHTANAKHDPSQPADRALVLRMLQEGLARRTSRAFLRAGGIPVVFVYRMERLSPGDWRWVLDQLAAKKIPVRLVGDATMRRYSAVAWGFHQYNPNWLKADELRAWNRQKALEMRLLRSRTPSEHLFAATVSPGFDATKRRGTDTFVAPRGPGGERYAGAWEAALASAPEWVVVSTWNEWFEGSAVEPSVNAGDLALRQTAEYAARFKR